MNKQIGEYRVIREIARGGMGVVYLAEQLSLKRLVALKVLPFVGGGGNQKIRRFRREAEAAGKLHHENIVPIYDVGEEDGTYFFSMEYIEGRTLDAVVDDLKWSSKKEISHDDLKSVLASESAVRDPTITKEQVPEGSEIRPRPCRNAIFEAVRIIRELARALQYAHELGVIHRDVKPANIIVDADGKPHLMDFGLARDEDDSAITLSGDIFGTPKYMSPEQVRARRGEIDGRTDIYSLGVTLYELVTLQLPYSGESSPEILRNILSSQPIRPRKYNRNLPSDLETIILKTLEKDPHRRYETAGALADDLDRFLNYEAIHARLPHPVVRCLRAAKRSRAKSGVAVVAMLVGFAVAFWTALEQQTTLTVVTTPPGASVFVDGAFLGKTPLEEALLTPGEHALKLELSTYLEHKETIQVSRGKELHLDRMFEKHTFLLSSFGGGGEIILRTTNRNGDPIEIKDNAGREIQIPRAGIYTVQLKKKDCLPVTGKVEIMADGTWGEWQAIEGPTPYKSRGGYEVIPVQNVGLLRLNFSDEARVLLTGPAVGKKPLALKARFWQDSVKPGDYSLQVDDPDYYLDGKSFRIQRTETKEISLPLERVKCYEYPTSPTRFRPVFADISGDGRLHLLVACERTADERTVGQILILSENFGKLEVDRTIQLERGTFLSPPVAVDLDRDGTAELIAVVDEGGLRSIRIFSALSGALKQDLPIELGEGALTEPIIADLDLNGFPDFALGVAGGGIEVVWGGKGGPERRPPLEIPGLEALARECVDFVGSDGVPEFLCYESTGELVARSSQDGSVKWRRPLSEPPFGVGEFVSRIGGSEVPRSLPFFALVDLDASIEEDGGDWEIVVRTASQLSVFRADDGSERIEYPIEGSDDLSIETPFVIGNVFRNRRGNEILVPTRLGIDVLAFGQRIARISYPAVDEQSGLVGAGPARISLALAPVARVRGEPNHLDLILALDGGVYGIRAKKKTHDEEPLFQFYLESGDFLGPCIGDIDGNGTVEIMGASSEGGVFCLIGNRPQQDWGWHSPNVVEGAFRTGRLDRDGVPDLAFVERPVDPDLTENEKQRRLVLLSGRTGRVLRHWRFSGATRGGPEFVDIDGDNIDEILLVLESQVAGPTYRFVLVSVDPDQPPHFVDLVGDRGGETGLQDTRVIRSARPNHLGVVRFESDKIVAEDLLIEADFDYARAKHLRRSGLPKKVWERSTEELFGDGFRLRVPKGERGLVSIPVVPDLNGDGYEDLLVEIVSHWTDEDDDGDGVQLVALSGRDGSILWMGIVTGGETSLRVAVRDLDQDGKPDILVKVFGEAPPGVGQGNTAGISRVHGIHGATGIRLFWVDVGSLLAPEQVVDVTSIGGELVCVSDQGTVGLVESSGGTRTWTIRYRDGGVKGGFASSPRLVSPDTEQDSFILLKSNLVSRISVPRHREMWRYRPTRGRRTGDLIRNVEMFRLHRRRLVVVQEQVEGRFPWASIIAYGTKERPEFLWGAGCASAARASISGQLQGFHRASSRGELNQTKVEQLIRKIDPSHPAYFELDSMRTEDATSRDANPE